MPAGLPLEAAAAWVGHACWAEVRLGEVVTAWLGVEDDPARVVALWSARSDAAERAGDWHRRLPELREFPRSAFVAPSSPEVAALFDDLEALASSPEPDERTGALAATVRGLRLGYHRHQSVAVGPADAPIATTLRRALRSTYDSAEGDPAVAWTDRVEAAGGLP